MNILGLFGITDIIIFLLFIIMVLIGWKKGFFEKFIKIANSIFGLIFSIIFAGRFADFIGPRWLNALIQPKVYDNVISSQAIQNINGNNVSEGILNVLNELGFPNFLSQMIAKIVDSNVTDTTIASLQSQIATSISNQMTRFIVVIIAFLLLFVGTSIMAFILKQIIKLLRTSKIFKTLDGILGLLFMTLIYFVVIYCAFIIISLIMPISSLTGFNDFMITDMQLNSDAFRLSKYFYENNIIGNFFKIFF